MKKPDDGLLGVGAALSIGVSGADEMVDSLLGTKLAESARLRLCEILPPSVGLLLRISSNLGGAVAFVGVGGVLTITGGVPWSDAGGGVPGGVLVSMDCAGARERRLVRSVGARLCSCAPSVPTFDPGSVSASVCLFGRSGTGG